VGKVAQHPASDGKSPRTVRVDDLVAEVGRLVGEGSVPEVYRERVLSQRTRRFEIGAAGKPVEILHTLLGIELKIGKRRLLCPDLASARYLRVFARLGVATIAIPYDITQVSRAADELESAWHRTMLLADHLTAGRSARLRGLVQARLVGLARAEIERHGAGAARPTFVQYTRQRRRRDEL
jgi:hypothetical protein